MEERNKYYLVIHSIFI